MSFIFNEFEIFILSWNGELESRMIKITTTKRSIKQCEIVLRKPCINRESKSRISQFSFIVIVVT